ncbi:hypothetical protein D6D15_01554 [Aureobasidium pullulans]|uniref:Carboxylic ester hydrolase n=1 Tax=Aureobasidium pullulans TaxID=5580 RepID=A0A4S9BPE7_AURPU|nr:hypothetical protein D6D15_01554 [Aureobasidium pullulans]
MDIVTPKHTDILLFALIVDPADLQPTVGTDLAPDIDLHRGENPLVFRSISSGNSGYTLGNGANAAAGSNFVNRSDGGLIFVTIQHRLGGYGFLSSDAIEEDGAPNAGLLDVRVATEWVQRNIRAFGGDPSKITIRGDSAGGGAVANQLTMYGGQPSPPSRVAIAESL